MEWEINALRLSGECEVWLATIRIRHANHLKKIIYCVLKGKNNLSKYNLCRAGDFQRGKLKSAAQIGVKVSKFNDGALFKVQNQLI